MGAHIMEQNPQELSQVYSVPSAHIQHPVPSAYQIEFNSSSFTTGLRLPPNLASDSLPPATSSLSIHQPQLNPSFPGPSTIPSQGVIKKVLHLLILHSFIIYKIVHGTSRCVPVCMLTWCAHRYMNVQCNQAREQNFSKSLFWAKNCTDMSTCYQNGCYNCFYCNLQNFIFPIYS